MPMMLCAWGGHDAGRCCCCCCRLPLRSMYGVFDGHEGQAASQLLADSLPRRLVQAARELMEAEACPEGAAGNW